MTVSKLYNKKYDCIYIYDTEYLEMFRRNNTNIIFEHNGKLRNVYFDINVYIPSSNIIAHNIYGKVNITANTIICKSIDVENIICDTIITSGSIITRSNTNDINIIHD